MKIMKSGLIINPYLEILFEHRLTKPRFDAQPDVDFFLVSPIPQKGLNLLGISKLRHPNLYELFLDLSKLQFDFLDIENDLDEHERIFLLENGVIVKENDAPEKPLFYCLLDEVESKLPDSDISNLIVNPTFHFEPFSFENLRDWMIHKHFSPHQPSVWIRQPVTKITVGYWLDEEQAETISNFKAGERPPFEIESELVAKLCAAEILVSADKLRRQEQIQFETIERAKNEFQRANYTVLRELLSPPQMNAMRRFYRDFISQGFMIFGDQQVDRRFMQPNEPLARVFHENLTRVMSLVAGKNVKPSYVFAASYREFAELLPHTDRKQCEFSISFQVDYQPETENHVSPWGLYISQPDFPIDFEKPFKSAEFPARSAECDAIDPIYLASGDAVFYKGCEVIHYRYGLPAGHQSTSLFFHYVPEDFSDDLLR